MVAIIIVVTTVEVKTTVILYAMNVVCVGTLVIAVSVWNLMPLVGRLDGAFPMDISAVIVMAAH
jgi:hypothetical protein